MCACLARGRSSGLTRYGQILCSSLPPNVAYCLGDAIRLGSVSYCVRARLYRGWLSGLSKLCQIARVDKIIGGDLPRWRKLMCRMCVGVFAFMSIALFDVRVSIHAVTSLTSISSHLGVRVVADKCADGSLEPSPDGFNKSLHRA